MLPEPAGITLEVIQAFDKIGIPYFIGGSLASAFYGVTRSTLDADLVADIQMEQIEKLVKELQKDFYIDNEMIQGAIEHEGSFNLIHLETMFKVDVFVLKHRPYDLIQFGRRTLQAIVADSSRFAYLSTAEDIILAKLEWYRLGGEVSDRQWNDILGVLKIQGDRLDQPFIVEWAKKLGVLDLLNRALEETKLAK